MNGCDYMDGLPGIGLKTAIKLMKEHGCVEAILADSPYGKSAPSAYLEDFQRARMTFRHQRVFCQAARGIVHLTPRGDERNDTEDDFLGKHLDADLAERIATGLVDTKTLQPIEMSSTAVFADSFVPSLPPAQMPPKHMTVDYAKVFKFRPVADELVMRDPVNVKNDISRLKGLFSRGNGSPGTPGRTTPRSLPSFFADNFSRTDAETIESEEEATPPRGGIMRTSDDDYDAELEEFAGSLPDRLDDAQLRALLDGDEPPVARDDDPAVVEPPPKYGFLM